MVPNLDLAELNQQINQWLALMVDTQQQPLSPESRQLVEQAIDQVRRGQATLNAEFAKEAAAFQKRIEALQKQNADTLSGLEALKKQASSFEMPPPPPLPAPPAIDPRLSFTLRDELLAHFHDEATRPAEAFQDFSAEFRKPDEQAAPAPAKPVPAHTPIEHTPPGVIAAMLELAGITASDVIYNLGCGDGRLLISAASRYHARGVGIDASAANVETARANIAKARLQKLVQADSGDPLRADVGQATVLVLALGAAVNVQVIQVVERQLKPGTRIVTHQGGMKGWPAERQTSVTDEGQTFRLRLWRVPASGDLSDSITNLEGPEWDG